MSDLIGLHTPDIGSPLPKKLLNIFRRTTGLSRARARPTLPTLPTTLLIQIFHHLALLDKACLALTCKSFHFIFSPVLDHEAFRFPRLYQLRIPNLHLTNAYGSGSSFGRPRRHLLRRLQDHRVKYCVKCMTLHRREAFAQPTYHGPMVYREYCWAEAGVVDLCPCVTLTIRDKDRLVRCLGRMAKGKSVCLGGALGRAFVLGVASPSSSTSASSLSSASASTSPSTSPSAVAPALLHECQISDCKFVAAQMRTVLYITPGCRRMLVAETEYNVTANRGVVEWQPGETFRDALYNLLWAMRVSEGGLLLDYGGGREHQREETLRVVRNLGSCELPVDGNWVKQDRMMSASFLRLMHAYGG